MIKFKQVNEMSILRRNEERCEECTHFEICNLRNNLASLRQTTHDLGKLMEHQKFNIVVECDCYDKKVVKRCEN